MDFLSGFLMQLLSTAGIIFLFGWIIALLRHGFCRVTGRGGPVILLITGIIGTPIHELSHALMCLIFGHKITDMQLYDPSAEDGTLGYVSHTYRKRNVYHQIGNFFIGVAPVLLGGIVIILLLALFLPDAFDAISSEIDSLCASDIASFPVLEFFSFVGTAIAAIFSGESLAVWQGWVFIILALTISTHMEMSGADIKSGLRGLAFLLVVMLAANGLIYLISPVAFSAITASIVSFGLALAAILSISALFLMLLLVIALIIHGIIRIFAR